MFKRHLGNVLYFSRSEKNSLKVFIKADNESFPCSVHLYDA